MLIDEARSRLLAMLADTGMDLADVTAADVRTVVKVFRRFAEISVDDATPVEEDDDGVLAQFGTFSFRGSREFETDLTRQFIETVDGDAHIWQLGCTFHWELSPETKALGSGDLWSFGKRLDDFFDHALA